MAFDWNEFLVFASTKCNDGDQSTQRVAVSRAYYAAYHKARIELASNNGPILNKHQEVWDAYNQSQDPDCRKVGSMGFTLKAKREIADYKDTTIITPKDVTSSIRLAAQVIELIDRIYP